MFKNIKKLVTAGITYSLLMISQNIAAFEVTGDLTHNFRSRFGDNTQGDFDGQVRSINNDGVMVMATLQGIWKREGKIVSMYTLDTFSDAGMIYAEGKVDLVEGTLKFKAFEF